MKIPNAAAGTLPLQSLMQWIINPFAFMETCAQRCGDMFTVPLGNKFSPIVFFSHPQALQEVLAGDTKQFDAPAEVNAIFRPLLGENGVITIGGARHRRQRQLLMPPFHGERMRAYEELIQEITEQVTSQWQLGKPFSTRAFMQQISLRVILRAVFGLVEGERYQQIEKLLSSMLDEMSSPLSAALLYLPFLQRDLGPLSPWAKFLRRQRQIDELLYTEIQERRAQLQPGRTDILSLLMSARDEAGEFMTDEELHDELMTLLVAGHETTATALTWAMYWIHHLPSVREKLLAEIDSLATEKNTIAKAPYLNAVCCETLRIYPVAMLTLPRVAKVATQLMGYDLEPETIMCGCIYLTHQREDLYPQPKRFQPERFLERQYSPYEFLPFGGGSRRCIGMAFAMFEMKVVLAKILSTLELSLADQRPVKPVRRGLTAASTDVKLVVTNQRQQKSRTLQTSIY